MMNGMDRPFIQHAWRAGHALGLALWLCACAGKSPSGPGTPDGRTPQANKLALVIIDGLRYSEGLGDPARAHVPRMGELAQQGSLIEPFRNDGVTVTARAVPAIWTGSWVQPISMDDPACGGAPNLRAAAPTVFEYFRKHRVQPALECIYVVGNVDCPWRASLDPEYGTAYWPTYETRGNSDLERWQVARQILTDQQPDFFLLYLPDVDHAAHGGDFAAYLSAIAVADRIVGELWAALQSSPHYAGITSLLVTNDHGRHDNRPGEPQDGFAGHGDGCTGCRTIQLLAIGPDIRVGHVSTLARSIPDIVPTIGMLMGFPTAHATGTRMTELLARQK
jgi:hypothetical protein